MKTPLTRHAGKLVLLLAFMLGFAGQIAAQDEPDPLDPNGAGGSGNCVVKCTLTEPDCTLTLWDWHCYSYNCPSYPCSRTEKHCFHGIGLCTSNSQAEVWEICGCQCA